ncbi:MAG: (2Fe-2S)-binding protein [Novosphingobium sp.]
MNGESHEVAVELQESLLNTLRNQLGLIGTKRGCDSGGCGCCTVMVDGKARYSCMTYTLAVEGQPVRTVEGLGSGNRLDALQSAFIEAGAVQCGYCTCGILMAARDLLDHNPDPTEDDIRKGISGNLCRCTGYVKIVEAIGMAAKAVHGEA